MNLFPLIKVVVRTLKLASSLCSRLCFQMVKSFTVIPFSWSEARDQLRHVIQKALCNQRGSRVVVRCHNRQARGHPSGSAILCRQSQSISSDRGVFLIISTCV